MGEYVKYLGHDIKLGTCENMYYYTYDQLAAILPMCEGLPGNDKPMAYLNPAHNYRYRFPFPDDAREDSPNFDFDRGVLVHIPEQCLHDEHGTVWLSMHPRSEQYAYNVNVEVDCPLSPHRSGRYSTGSFNQIAEIVQQRQIDGQLWTVLRCPYCHALWRLPPEAAARLVWEIAEERPELAAAVVDGYTRQL